MSTLVIVFRKELREIFRDRRTLIAIGLAALATPAVLVVISQVSTKTATQAYTVGYNGTIPTGLDILMAATGLKLEQVADPAAAAKQQVDIGVVFQPSEIDEWYDPTRQSAQIADTRLHRREGGFGSAAERDRPGPAQPTSDQGPPAQLAHQGCRKRLPELLPPLHPDHDGAHGRPLGGTRCVGRRART